MEQQQVSLVMVDAAGVLYSDEGAVPGVPETIRRISQKIPVWVATNNTSYSPRLIHSMLDEMEIRIPPERIISSGLGLAAHPDFRRMVEGKSVYTYGYPESEWYPRYAGGVLVSDPDAAEVFVLAASTGHSNAAEYSRVSESLQRNRNRRVICINPDYFVHTPVGRYPVIGYYAAQLVTELGIHIHWMGKPYPEFSEVVRYYLTQSGITLDRSVWFFDDNPRNVDRMTTDLGISGAVVMDSGLCTGKSLEEIQNEFGTIGQSRISTL